MKQRALRAAISAVMSVVGAAALLGVSTATTQSVASAAPCSDVEVVFARGTVETSPPLGITGISFVEALRSQLRGKSLSTYAVNYRASADFNNRLAFAHTIIDGVNDTQKRLRYLAATCPRTRIVLGGYSQGVVVAGYAVGPKVQVPAQYARYANYIPAPLAPDVLRRISSVVYFAEPSARFLGDAGAPPVVDREQLRGVTLKYCIPADNICNGAPLAGPTALHVLYAGNGMTVDAARRVAPRL